MTEAEKPIAETPSSEPKRLTETNFFDYLKLEHIRLISVSSDVMIGGAQLPDKAEITARTGIGVSHNKKNIHVNAIVDVTGRPDSTNQSIAESSLLRIKIQYQCVLSLVDATPDELLEYAEKVANAGTMMMWPHIRETIQYLCGRMGLPAPLLPIFVSTQEGTYVAGRKMQFQEIETPPEAQP